MARIRKGDLVAVMSGEDKGKRGRVLRVLPEAGRVVIEGVNVVFKHLKKSQKNPQGGRIQREASVHASTVMLIDPSTDKPTRVSSAVVDGRRVRVARKSRAVLAAPKAERAEKAEKAEKKSESQSKKAAKKSSGKADAASAGGKE
jgi:large subunit ribosomal protein L24